MSREVELGSASWTSVRVLLRVVHWSCSSTAVQRTLSLSVTLSEHSSWNSGNCAVPAQVVGQWPGDTALTPASIVLAAVHGLSGLFRAVSAVEPSLCRPLPTLSPSLIGHLASVDVKQHESKESAVGPSLISLMVSVDVKHHVYLLENAKSFRAIKAGRETERAGLA